MFWTFVLHLAAKLLPLVHMLNGSGLLVANDISASSSQGTPSQH